MASSRQVFRRLVVAAPLEHQPGIPAGPRPHRRLGVERGQQHVAYRPRIAGGRSSSSSDEPLASATARSTTRSSSRTLPGQSYVTAASAAAVDNNSGRNVRCRSRKLPRQLDDVVAPAAQRRHLHVDALDEVRQRAIRRDDDACVDAPGAASATRSTRDPESRGAAWPARPTTGRTLRRERACLRARARTSPFVRALRSPSAPRSRRTPPRAASRRWRRS